MHEKGKEIAVTIINAGDRFVVKTYQHQYRNLMVLLNNNIYLEDFGECGGQGRCATCIVKVSGLKNKIRATERNEATTLNKAGVSEAGIRLSCQILITEDLHGALVEIMDWG